MSDDDEISRHTPPARALVRLAAVMPRLLALALATLLAAPARAFYLPGVAPQDFARVRALALLALSSRAFAPSRRVPSFAARLTRSLPSPPPLRVAG